MEEITLRKREPNIIDIEYWCKITEYLDDDIRENSGEFDPYFRCYIYDCRNWLDNTVVIRMPGLTIGRVKFNDENEITECCISDDVLAKSNCFSIDINERLKQFVGRVFKFPEE